MTMRQNRFKNLIDASERLVERDRRLRTHIEHICAYVAAGRMSAESGIHDIAIQLRITPAYDPAEKTVALERQWYDITHRRNDQEAERLRRKRIADPAKRQRKLTTQSHFFMAEYRPTDEDIQHELRVARQDEADHKAIDEFLTDEPTIDPTLSPEEEAYYQKLKREHESGPKE